MKTYTKQYEAMVIIAPFDEPDIEPVISRIEAVIKENAGELIKTDRWQYKALAYKIADYDRGYYVLFTFSATPSCIKELDRILRIDERVLRHLIISQGA